MDNVRLLRPLLYQGILDCETLRERKDFKKWISDRKYRVIEIPDPKTVNLLVNDVQDYSKFLVSDSCRFACAAFESISSIGRVDSLPRSSAWMAIKAYYSAFFAAHAIMKCFGYSSSQIERGHVNVITELALASGIPSLVKAESGFFNSKIDQNTSMLVMRKVKNSHEDTWANFSECILSLSNDVLSLSGISSKKQIVSAHLSGIRDVLTDNGRRLKGGVLSEYRNKVNYQQSFDAWYPYSNRSIDTVRILSLVNQWNSAQVTGSAVWRESGDAYHYYFTCTQIVSLCFHLMNFIAAESSVKKNSFSQQAIRLVSLCEVA